MPNTLKKVSQWKNRCFSSNRLSYVYVWDVTRVYNSLSECLWVGRGHIQTFSEWEDVCIQLLGLHNSLCSGREKQHLSDPSICISPLAVSLFNEKIGPSTMKASKNQWHEKGFVKHFMFSSSVNTQPVNGRNDQTNNSQISLWIIAVSPPRLWVNCP